MATGCVSITSNSRVVLQSRVQIRPKTLHGLGEVCWEHALLTGRLLVAHQPAVLLEKLKEVSPFTKGVSIKGVPGQGEGSGQPKGDKVKQPL